MSSKAGLEPNQTSRAKPFSENSYRDNVDSG